jgi:hypothetical protein
VAKKEEPAVDLDFDLFDFAEVMPDDAHNVEEDIDLDKILSAFQEEEDNGELAAEVEDKEELDDELFNGAFKPAEGEHAEAPAVAPAEKPAPARQTPAPAPKAQAPEAQAPKAKAPKKVSQAAAQAAAEKVAAAAAPPKAPPEPSAEPASAAAPSEAPPRRRSMLWSSVLAAFLAMTLLNGLIAVVTLRSAHGLKGEMQSASAEMSEAALKLRAKVDEPALEPPPPREGPRTAPLMDESAAFERAEADIQEGRCAEARKRIYGVLAVIDRTPELRRAELEARSAFLLADSYRAEALKREEPR